MQRKKHTFNIKLIQIFQIIKVSHYFVPILSLYLINVLLNLTNVLNLSWTKNLCDFWKYVKKNRACNGMSNEISYNGTISSNKNKKANMFAKMFSSMYSAENMNIDYNFA